MPEGHRRSPRTSTLLPPYRAVLAVDTEKYSQAPSYHQQALNGTVRDVLQEAFARSGLEEVWRNASFPQSTGDGYLVGVDPRYLPHLIHPLLRNIQEVLEDAQPGLAFQSRELRLRLRASINVGPLPDSGGAERGDGIGRAMNETHRLLDSEAVRAALRQSHPDITLLAAIVSRRVYEDAVFDGFTGLNPRRFRAEHVRLPEKEYEAEGYLYVPLDSSAPNGVDRGDSGSVTEREAEDRARAGTGEAAAETNPPTRTGEAPTSGEANRTGDSSDQADQSGAVHGGVHTSGGTNTGQRGGVGNISGDVGTVVTDPRGPVNTGDGNQFNGPRFRNRGGVNYVAGDNSGTVRGDSRVGDGAHEEDEQ